MTVTQPWIPGARVVIGTQDGGSMLGPFDQARMTWHCTVSNPNTMTIDRMASFLQSKGAQGTIVHPLTGEIVQMIPGNRASRMLRNLAGGVQTNRVGGFHGQVEVIAMPEQPFTSIATPAGIAALQHITT